MEISRKWVNSLHFHDDESITMLASYRYIILLSSNWKFERLMVKILNNYKNFWYNIVHSYVRSQTIYDSYKKLCSYKKN